MRILFDLEIAIKDLYQKVTPEQEAFLDGIHKYVFDRIYILGDEIDSEEAANPKSATVIYLMKEPRGIQPRGYTKDLCDKINACFNENDSQLILDKAFEAVQNILN
jgi:hypothetical protein